MPSLYLVLIGIVVVLQSTFHDIDYRNGTTSERRQGIGVVHAPYESHGPQLELILRREPYDASPTIAYLDYRPDNVGGYTVAFEASEPGLAESLTKVDHDYAGLVVDATMVGWVRAIYGYTAKGDVRAGWVRLVPGKVLFVSYDENIQTQFPYFEDPYSVEFFDSPNGRRISFPLVPAGGKNASYQIAVRKIQGDWIQVAAEVPSTHPCSDYADAKVERTTTAWVRRYNAIGRYQIWYAHDSC